jgi:hypothetical protein
MTSRKRRRCRATLGRRSQRAVLRCRARGVEDLDVRCSGAGHADPTLRTMLDRVPGTAIKKPGLRARAFFGTFAEQL